MTAERSTFSEKFVPFGCHVEFWVFYIMIYPIDAQKSNSGCPFKGIHLSLAVVYI